MMDDGLFGTADGVATANAFFGTPVELYGATDGVASTEARWVKDLGIVATEGVSEAAGGIAAIRALAGWSGGWSLCDLRVGAVKLVTVLAYGMPFVTDATPQQTVPMCLRHEQDAVDKGLFVYSEPLTLTIGGPCWVCNPQFTVWGDEAPSSIP